MTKEHVGATFILMDNKWIKLVMKYDTTFDNVT